MLDIDVQLARLYSWAPTLTRTRPNKCEPLRNHGVVYGFSLTWGDDSWPRKLVIKVMAEYGNCVELDHAGKHRYILWIRGDGIETNQPDLVRLNLGGYYRLQIDGNGSPAVVEGLEEVVRATFGL